MNEAGDRRAKARTLGTTVGIIAILMLATSAAGAMPADSLTGSLVLDRAVIQGEVSLRAEGNQTFAWRSESAQQLDVAFSGSAQAVTVNWTHRQGYGVGQSDTDPNGSYVTITGDAETGEETYRDNIRIHGDFQLDRANMMAIIDTSSTATMSTSNPASLKANRGENWYVGLETNESTDAGPMTHQHSTKPGTPLLIGSTSETELIGNVTLYVWGGNLTVETANGTSHTYRSGVWSENYADSPVPTNPVKEEHQQLLRLHLTGAVFQLSQDSGLIKATADLFNVGIDGRIQMNSATGELHRGNEVYTATGQQVLVAGTLMATVDGAPHGDGNLKLVLAPSEGAVAGPEATISDRTSDLVGDNRTAAPDSGIITDPSQNRPDVAWLAAAFAILPAIAAGSTWLIMRTRERKVPPATAKIIAEEAIAQNQPQEARRWIRPVLRKDPTDVDAWFVYGASLAQEKRYRDLRDELGPRFDTHGDLDSPSVCFLLGLAATKEDDEAAATRWLDRASRDPVLRHRIATDPLFSSVNATPSEAQTHQTEVVAYA